MLSIRRQLLLWQITALLLTALVVSGITYSLAWQAFNKVRDYTLEQVAHAILRHGVEPAGEDNEWKDEGRFVSQIWEAPRRAKQPKLVFNSRPEIDLPPQGSGAGEVHFHGEAWRTYTLRHSGLIIQVASPIARRVQRFTELAGWLLIPLAVLVAGLGSLIWMAVARALRPLERVRHEIVERDSSSLHPIDLRAVPNEIVPLGEALNDLLARLDRSLTAQRRFIADAAHELRTPLTALKLQSQLAAQADNETERQDALSRLAEGVERATHLVNQLLVMARLEPVLARAEAVPVALDGLVKTVIGDYSTLAEAKDIDLGLTASEAVIVSGAREGLRVLLGNVIDNAIRYTPAGGRIDVALRAEPELAVITVQDTGPGIPWPERSKVFERFYRLPGTGVPGSGLGLAIVRELVDLQHGSIYLDRAPSGGLKVEIRLPRQVNPG